MAIDLDRAYAIATDPVFRGRLSIVISTVAADKFAGQNTPAAQKRLATRIANAPYDYATVFAPGVVADLTGENQVDDVEVLESIVNARFALHAGD